MASAEYEVQRAVYAALIADVDVSALVADRILDFVNEGTLLPYVTLGEGNFQRSDGVGLSGGSLYLTLHAWSEKPGSKEVKQVADAVVLALHNRPLILPTNRLVTLDHRYTNTMRDRDGLTSHAIMNFAAYIEKP